MRKALSSPQPLGTAAVPGPDSLQELEVGFLLQRVLGQVLVEPPAGQTDRRGQTDGRGHQPVACVTLIPS